MGLLSNNLSKNSVFKNRHLAQNIQLLIGLFGLFSTPRFSLPPKPQFLGVET